MSNYTNLASNNAILTNLSASRNTRLSSNYSVGANFHVMGYLDQVIKLYSLAYYCRTHRRAVNSCIRADLYVFFNNYISYLAYLTVTALPIWHEAKSIS